jgi:hypothetical protein
VDGSPYVEAPPPIGPPRRNNRGLWIALGLAGIGCLGALVLLVVGGIALQHIARNDPLPAPGFGSPHMVRQLEGGWAVYRFDDLGLSMELPGPPEPGEYDWGVEHRLMIRRWAYYFGESESANLELEAIWYRPVASYESLDEFLESELEDFGEPVRKTDERRVQIDGREGIDWTADYEYEGEPARVRGLGLIRGSTVWTLRIYFYPDVEKEANEEFERMRDSIVWSSSR